jgi:hypothetical protein
MYHFQINIFIKIRSQTYTLEEVRDSIRFFKMHVMMHMAGPEGKQAERLPWASNPTGPTPGSTKLYQYMLWLAR